MPFERTIAKYKPRSIFASVATLLAIGLVAVLTVICWVTYIWFGFHTGRQVATPDGRYVAGTAYSSWEHRITLEVPGFHPFGRGRDTAYSLGELHANVTDLKWTDNHTLVVYSNDSNHGYSFTTTQWHDIKVVFQLDTQRKVDPLADRSDWYW